MRVALYDLRVITSYILHVDKIEGSIERSYDDETGLNLMI